jgi:hypothetical protein
MNPDFTNDVTNLESLIQSVDEEPHAHDVEGYGEKVVEIVEYLEDNGYEVKKGSASLPSENDVRSYLEASDGAFLGSGSIHTPYVDAGGLSGFEQNIQQENNQDITHGINLSDIEKVPIKFLDSEPSEDAIIEEDGEKYVIVEGDIKPYLMARDENGYGLFGENIGVEDYPRNDIDEEIAGFERGNVSFWFNTAAPRDGNVLIKKPEGDLEREELEPKLEDIAESLDGVKFDQGDQGGNSFKFEYDTSMREEELVETVEALDKGTHGALRSLYRQEKTAD